MLPVSIYLEDPFPKEPSTSSGRSFSNYCRRPGFVEVLSLGLTALGSGIEFDQIYIADPSLATVPFFDIVVDPSLQSAYMS